MLPKILRRGFLPPGDLRADLILRRDSAQLLPKESLLSMHHEYSSTHEKTRTPRREYRDGDNALAELQNRLENVLRSTGIATVFLDNEWRIRSFTPAIRDVYDLVAADVGKPISQFTARADAVPPLPETTDLTRDEVAEDLIETECGKWFLRRVLPYQSSEGKVDGIMVTFIDITEQKQIEARLKESESVLLAEKQKLTAALREVEDAGSKLRVLFDQSTYYTGIVDLSGTLIDVNRCAIEPFDFTREDAIGKKFWETPWWTGHAQSRRKLKQVFPRVVQGEPYHGVLSFRGPGNTHRLSEFNYQPARNKDGEIVFVVVTGNDVTERVTAERDLADNRQRLRMAMDAARMGAFEWEPERDRAFISKGLGAITGLPAGRQEGADFMSRVHREDMPALRIAIDKAMNESGEYFAEFRFVRPDGAVRWLAARGMRVDPGAGRPTKLVGLNWDITESKQQQRRVIASEERLRLALGAAKLRLWQWDVDEDRWYWSADGNSCNEVTPEMHLGTLREFLSLVHPSDRNRVKASLHHSLADGSPVRIEYRVKRDGAYGWALSMAHLSVKDEYSPAQMIGVELDITERKQNELSLIEARKAAEAANQSKSNFLATMSHEIRTPMTAILGYTDVLLDQVHEPEAIDNLHTILRNGNFLLDIINDILDLSKIEAGKLDVSRERFEPARLVADVHSIMHVRAKEKNLYLNVKYDGKIPKTVESDSKRLKQILINLVGNAIKFTHRGGVEIAVKFVKGEHPMIRFDVRDTGIGMTEIQKGNLFQPFIQGDARIDRDFGGTGLGLAISQRLAKVLGGKISMTSTPGIGSKFSCAVTAGDIAGVEFIRPRTAAETDVPQAADSTVRLDCHVLVVDDRRDIRFLSKRILSNAGASVSEAVDGVDAIEKVQEARDAGKDFDAIVLDMQMPRMDGYRAATLLREMRFEGPIIAVTAEAMEGAAARCIDSGCNDYLSKPIQASKLTHLVSELLTRFR